MGKVLFLGGAFDPLHQGHIAILQAAQAAISPELVYLVPLRQPVHKPALLFTPEQRLVFLKAALVKYPQWQLHLDELERETPSYTVDTLQRYHERHPNYELYWLIGSDEYLDFWQWRQPEKILALATMVICQRPGNTKISPPSEKWKERFLFVKNTKVDISSTRLRSLILAKQYEAIKAMIPFSVDLLY